MDKIKNSKEFKELCQYLKTKGIIKTKEEYLKLMINITKEHFKKQTTQKSKQTYSD